jgi:hypothetical protein
MLQRAREVINRALLGYNASYTECKPPQPEPTPVYCLTGSDHDVCSRKQLFCEALCRRSVLSTEIKGLSCRRYSMVTQSSE